MRRGALLALLAVSLSAVAASQPLAAPVVPAPTTGTTEQVPFAPTAPPVLSEARAKAAFLAEPKVRDWLARYPPRPTIAASFDRTTRRWKLDVWSGAAGEVATGRVDDGTGQVVEAWTGPQVAWKMARGRPGAFGGEILNAWWVWIPLSLVFLLGLVDVRRLRSWHTADLLALVSFGLSLWFFNRGEIFRSVPLAVPPLVFLLARTAWSGFRGRSVMPQGSWPVWLLAAVAVFLAGFRLGLDLEAPHSVIDVGYAGVIGADRILHGQAPYGHMPVQDAREPCGRADADGEIRDRIQTNGRCESSNPRGDTYGPVAYLVYVPAVLTLGWSGKWDSLPAAHATAIGFDALVVLGLVLVGLRLGDARLAVTLAFAWLAYPFTAYVLATSSNDAIMPALLVWGFWLATSAFARGTFVALAGWTKFAALLLAPLWLLYPDGPRRAPTTRFVTGFGVATVAAFSILLLEPGLVDAVRTFSQRTLGFQLDRDSPFSIWDWGQYHARGIPDLADVQLAVQVGVLALAGVAAVLPRRKGPLELAALTAAILIGFELALTHWFYLYIAWFLPFVLIASLAPRTVATER